MRHDQPVEPETKQVRYLNGVEAAAEISVLQIARDRAKGLKTGAFVSGYRGSPLSGFDRTISRRIRDLPPGEIVFQPGLNEELAATAVWGSQQVGLSDPTDFEGVTGYWYAKAPGVDRSTDALRHANHAGTARFGGVLALLGDDHTCKSSTLPNYSEFIARHVGMPLLFPATVQEVIDFGLAGVEMSRYAGVWVGLKCLIDTMDASAPAILDPNRVEFTLPTDVDMPLDGLSIRWPDAPADQEKRLINFRLPAAVAFARANGLNRIEEHGTAPKLGVVTAGKSWLDTRQALGEIAKRTGHEPPLSLFKAGLIWPLDETAIRDFAIGLDAILVIEEKAAILEDQVRAALYNVPADARPTVEGRRDRTDHVLFPETGDLNSLSIAAAIARRCDLPDGSGEAIAREIEAQLAGPTQTSVANRTPYFCAGCPHSTSTRVPEGSRALAGIGCHFMAQWMDRETGFYTQMGGEGAGWLGQAPFVNSSHIFANLGDGTYNHSGILAIRAAVAAKANITYKILFNDAVAMTGGQANEGGLDVPRIVEQVWAEGARAVAVVTDDTARYRNIKLPNRTQLLHRDRLDEVQRRFRDTSGLTVIVYDQGCATELRRKRKRGELPTPVKRVFIDPEVCEGCGDCGIQSNCVAIKPLETPLGTKRAIDQSSCNSDYSCLKGFCPSFITVECGEPVKPGQNMAPVADLPPPPAPDPTRSHDMVIAGVGGSGVVSLGAMIGRAAKLAGRDINVLDMIGLAQKGGPVVSQIRMSPQGGKVVAMRIAPGGADLVVGADAIVAASADVLRLCGQQTVGCIEALVAPSADFVLDSDYQLPVADVDAALSHRIAVQKLHRVPAVQVATSLLGNAIAANAILMGYAVQTGILPLSPENVESAIDELGNSVTFNIAAFRIGRRFAVDPEAVCTEAGLAEHLGETTLTGLIDDRVRRLVAYQNEAYAARYMRALKRLERITLNEPAKERLLRSAAHGLFRLMAYKDEYEVARLISTSRLRSQIEAQYGKIRKQQYHLAPPLLPGRDAAGRPKKRAFGAWMRVTLHGLQHLKFLRGTPFDPFGYAPERRAERAFIHRFEGIIETVADVVTEETTDAAVAILDLGAEVRGYGPVKDAARHRIEKEWDTRLPQLMAAAGQQTQRSKDDREEKAPSPSLVLADDERRSG
ncbi:MAG: indolepyruvate ferredoxin oxidoreductase family protein [Phyllobacteriaceae bacterium]|nr:indolepyruvate ferredoxin oxidoreductase family protein [Phyllobacteriaceae bacterium]